MEMAKFARFLLAASMICGVAAFSARAGGRASPGEFGKVDFGAKELQFADGCVLVEGQLHSGSFFEDLKRTDVHGRFEFRKNGAEVAEYPESVTTLIRLVGERCAAAPSNSPAAVFNGDSYSLKFELEWKEGVQMRPVTLSPGFTHCDGYLSTALPRRDLTVPTVVCQMTVDSRGVPLLDHLIVSIFAADGTRLTRLSAAP